MKVKCNPNITYLVIEFKGIRDQAISCKNNTDWDKLSKNKTTRTTTYRLFILFLWFSYFSQNKWVGKDKVMKTFWRSQGQFKKKKKKSHPQKCRFGNRTPHPFIQKAFAISGVEFPPVQDVMFIWLRQKLKKVSQQRRKAQLPSLNLCRLPTGTTIINRKTFKSQRNCLKIIFDFNVWQQESEEGKFGHFHAKHLKEHHHAGISQARERKPKRICSKSFFCDGPRPHLDSARPPLQRPKTNAKKRHFLQMRRRHLCAFGIWWAEGCRVCALPVSCHAWNCFGKRGVRFDRFIGAAAGRMRRTIWDALRNNEIHLVSLWFWRILKRRKMIGNKWFVMSYRFKKCFIGTGCQSSL